MVGHLEKNSDRNFSLSQNQSRTIISNKKFIHFYYSNEIFSKQQFDLNTLA